MRVDQLKALYCLVMRFRGKAGTRNMLCAGDFREGTSKRVAWFHPLTCLLPLFALHLNTAFAETTSGDLESIKPDLVTQTGHAGWISAVAVSPDGRWLATGGEDSILRIWSIHSSQVVRIFGEQGGVIQGLAFGPDSNRLVAAIRSTNVGWAMRVTGIQVSAGNRLEMLDISTGQTIWSTPYPLEIRDLALSADGRTLVTGGYDKRPSGLGFLRGS